MTGAVLAAFITGLIAIVVFVATKYLERRAVSTAVFAEIERLLTVVSRHRAKWAEWQEKGETGRHPLIPFSCDVYEKHVASLGLLKPKYVGNVVKFYGYLNFINALQATQKWYWQGENERAFDAIYLASLEQLTRDFEFTFARAFKTYRLAALSGAAQTEWKAEPGDPDRNTSDSHER